jgi:hypothetical protein
VTKTSKPTAASRKRSRKPTRQKTSRRPERHALLAFAAIAKKLRLRWYVFGAQAVNLHGFPRATADLDVTIELGECSIESLVSTLARAGFTPRFSDAAFIAITRVVPLVHQASQLPLDVVLAGPGLEQRFLDEVEHRTIGRQSIPVLSAENLIVTKLLAARPKDLQDIRELIAIRKIDHRSVDRTLVELEDVLGQSDLRPLYRRLRDDAK